jgi:hypothetical protein
MTNLIRRVEKEDAAKMLSEISTIEDLFGNHYRGNTAYKGSALDDGKSVWIHEGKLDDIFLLDDKLPFVSSYIRDTLNLLDSKKVGRAYVYNLGPGLEIFEHVDRQQYYHITKRYHIYFDVTDIEIRHSGPPVESNTVIFFNPLEPHAYKNNSDKPLIFIVFDTYNETRNI